MRRIYLLLVPAVLAVALAVSCTVPPTPTTTTTTTVPQSELALLALSTSAGRVELGQGINIRFAEPLGAEGDWVVERSGLLPGLAFNTTNGVVSGTATEPGPWYVRVHFSLTGGIGDNVLPYYEVLGAVSEDPPIAFSPPEGTFHPHTSGLVAHVYEYPSRDNWTVEPDGSPRVPDSFPVASAGGIRLAAEEFDYKSRDFFPFVMGYLCDSMQVRLPSSTLWANPVDHFSPPGAEVGSTCSTRSSKNHRHFAVAERTPAGTVRMHMLGTDAATQLWVTDVPVVTSSPSGTWLVADDGSTVAFVDDAVGAVVVDAAGATVVDLPGEMPDAWCRFIGDTDGRVDPDLSNAPLTCSHSTGENSVGHIDLLDGSSEMHMVADLTHAAVNHEYVGGWTTAEAQYSEGGSYSGSKQWLVNVSTGETELIYEHVGPVDPDLSFSLYAPV